MKIISIVQARNLKAKDINGKSGKRNSSNILFISLPSSKTLDPGVKHFIRVPSKLNKRP